MSERYKLDAEIYFRESTQEWVLELNGVINDCSFTNRHTAPRDVEPEDVAGLGHLYDDNAATVIEQQAEIERLREALGNLWSWCRNWDAEFIYDDEFDRGKIESALETQ